MLTYLIDAQPMVASLWWLVRKLPHIVLQASEIGRVQPFAIRGLEFFA